VYIPLQNATPGQRPAVSTSQQQRYTPRATGYSLQGTETYSLAGAPDEYPPPTNSLILFFVVGSGNKIGDKHWLSQKDVQYVGEDSFFQWLRDEYYKRKKFWARWMGLREFSHCDFYKV
jgi:hypothetical protein